MARGEQALLFLNRRGYAPVTLCRKCGFKFECPNCSAWLVEHRFRRRLECHHCGKFVPIPEKCPNCEAENSLVACGPGIERIAEEVAELFPDARRVLLSSDLTPNIAELRQTLREIEEREVDIVIGTQLVAKGHHFPGLALVGVVDGDLGLAQADPRAAERTFQLLTQVTGRAGREAIKGRGLIQTYMPEHPVVAALVSGDRDTFLAREIEERRKATMPPFGRLAALLVSASSREAAESYAREVARAAPAAAKIEVLGPAEAPLAVIRGRYRFRLAGEGRARSRPPGLSASLAVSRAQSQGRCPPHRGHRPLQFLVSNAPAPSGRDPASSLRSWPRLVHSVVIARLDRAISNLEDVANWSLTSRAQWLPGFAAIRGEISTRTVQARA